MSQNPSGPLYTRRPRDYNREWDEALVDTILRRGDEFVMPFGPTGPIWPAPGGSTAVMPRLGVSLCCCDTVIVTHPKDLWVSLRTAAMEAVAARLGISRRQGRPPDCMNPLHQARGMNRIGGNGQRHVSFEEGWCWTMAAARIGASDVDLMTGVSHYFLEAYKSGMPWAVPPSTLPADAAVALMEAADKPDLGDLE